jgi:hypothetical protein
MSTPVQAASEPFGAGPRMSKPGVRSGAPSFAQPLLERAVESVSGESWEGGVRS